MSAPNRQADHRAELEDQLAYESDQEWHRKLEMDALHRADRRAARRAELKERFAHEYVQDLDATAAYTRIRPHVTSATARTLASRLLTKVDVQARIRALKAEQIERLKIDADRVLQELAVVAFSNIWNYQIGEGGRLELAAGVDPRATRALASVKHRTTRHGDGERARVEHTVEYRLWDKVAALAKLGEHLKLWKHDQANRGKAEVIVDADSSVRIITPGDA